MLNIMSFNKKIYQHNSNVTIRKISHITKIIFKE